MDDGSSWEHPLQRAVELASSAESRLLLAVRVKRMSNQRPIEWTFCSCQSADRNRRRWGWLSEAARHLLAQWDQHDSPPAALSRDVTHCSEKLVSKETTPWWSLDRQQQLVWTWSHVVTGSLVERFPYLIEYLPPKCFLFFSFFLQLKVIHRCTPVRNKKFAQNEQLISVLCCPPHRESTFRMTCSWPEGRIEWQNWRRDVLL